MHFTLNRNPIHAEGIAPQTTLLDFLRARGFTGSKEGCAEGECGACTVVLVKANARAGSEYRPVNSCLLWLPMLHGQEVFTVEALAAGGELSAVQRALVEFGGSQCGYCTPGFVMSLFAEYYRPGRTGACDPHAMSGNLCRCTGYRPIRDAALSLGAAAEDAFKARLGAPPPALPILDYAGPEARFLRPDTLPDGLAALAADPAARAVAGATDLAVESNLRDRRWSTLISLEAIDALRVFVESDEAVEMGAALTLSEIEERWSAAPPIVREWLPLFSSPLIRNRATLGGNLATASPIGDAAPLLLALDARLKLISLRGERIVPLDGFFRAYRETVLEPGELIASIVIPKPFPDRARFFKVAKRPLDDISTVAAAFALRLDGDRRIAEARIAYGGVAATPIRSREAEAALRGRVLNERAIDAACDEISGLQPLSDHRGSAGYRLAMAQSLLRKFYVETEGM